MKPLRAHNVVATIGDALLIHGDAFIEMPPLGDVDCIITDPPYNRKTHQGARTTRRGCSVSLIDFDSLTEAQFIAFCGNAIEQARRWVIMTCAWQHAAELERAGLPLVRLGVWHKPNGAPQFTGDRPGTGWEAIAILHREGKKRWNGGGHHAVWVCNVEHGVHPTQKPLKLVLDWVAKFTEPGETVLDPFAGSGTTGVACVKLGRKFVGIEKRRDYFELACHRIADAARKAACLDLRGAEAIDMANIALPITQTESVSGASGVLTVSEVAAELRCSKAHVLNLIHGKVSGAQPLPSLWLGRRCLVRRCSLDQWIAANEHGAVL